MQSGAVGIGLLRTEFMFMNRETIPDEATQTESYRTIVEAMDGDPVSIRVLDWGGEKDIEALSMAGIVPRGRGRQSRPRPARHPPAAPPAGALRDTNLRRSCAPRSPDRSAMHSADGHHGERGAGRRGRSTIRVARRLRRRGERLPEKLPPLGIMIETPGAALSADALALETDFFAIGTNDLTAYTLAVDRAESDVAELYDPIHPAVLRLVQFATEAAMRMRMPVSVCGEMAANPRLTPLLLGLGLRSFSMNASAVPRVKQVVRGVDIDTCARFSAA